MTNIEYPENILREQMAFVRDYCSLFHALRKKMDIPVRQPLLDFSFGGEKVYPGFIEIMAKEINIYDLGYSFEDPLSYRLFDEDSPDGDNWETFRKDGKWVALYVYMPEWLKKVGEKRRLEREAIKQRKGIK